VIITSASGSVTSSVVSLQTPPHIEVFNGTNFITNGETIPVNFGSVQPNTNGLTVTFMVTNTGSEALNLEEIEVPADYTLNANYPATIAALSNGTFSVQLNTTNVGVSPATFTSPITIPPSPATR